MSPRKPVRQGEGVILDAIQARLALMPGVRLERNSRVAVVKSNRMVRGGLGDNGSADLVGLVSVRVVLVGVEPVRQVDTGRGAALEVKREGEIPTAEDIARIRAKLPLLVRCAWGTGGMPRVSARALKVLAPDDRHVLEQEAWMASWRAAGGFACYVDSPASAVAAVERCRAGASS